MWWRRYYPLLFALAIALNLLELGSLTVFHWNGSTGVTTTVTEVPYVQAVSGVQPPASGTSIRVGDRIDERELLAANNGQNPSPGKPYVIVAHRGTQTVRATILPSIAAVRWDQTIRLIAVAWVLLFAVLIVSRGAKSVENDYLALILLLMAAQSAPDRTILPDVRDLTIFRCTLDTLSSLADFTIVCYAVTFGRPLIAWRRFFFVFSSIAIGVLTLFGAANDVAGLLWIWFDQNVGGWSWLNSTYIETMIFLALANAAAAIPYAKPDERQRVGWVIVSFLPFLVGVTVGNFSLETGVWSALQNISFFFIPAGLTYAALARRLFDVGFVLNRAAVFAGVSTIVVGAFVLLEWALGKWFEDLNHGENVAVNAALALGLGLSIRWIHRYVDTAVDTVFFRKRHENERAIRRFAHEVVYLTDETAILTRATSVVASHTDATSTELLLADRLDENDAAIVALRAWNEPIDLHRYATALVGELAFPMLVRGTLVGVIVLGAKRNGERYAPDEIDALQALAHGVGVALHGLDGRNSSGDVMMQRLEEHLVGITSRLDAMATRLGATESR